MTKVRTGLGAIASTVLGMLSLAGCSGSDGNGGGSNPPPPVPETVANFNITTGELPFPADPFFFAGSTDGTINMQVVLPTRPETMRGAINSLDGWGLATQPWTGFSQPLLPASINANTVKVVKVYLNPTNKAPVDVTDPVQVAAYLPAGWNVANGPVAGVLTYGVDYTASVDPAIDSGGRILTITPLKPFAASSGPAVNGPNKILNVGYIVYLTNGLTSTIGVPFGPDTFYAAIKAAPADCSSITDATQKLVCQFTKPQLAIAAAAGLSASNVILSWSFSTQSMNDAFAVITATATAKPTVIVPLFDTTLGRIINTADLGAQGKANLYVGSTQLPYYLTATDPTQTLQQQNAAVNQSFWTAQNAPPPPLANPAGQAYSYVTMFNPIPHPTTTVTVPILVTVPRTDGHSACPGMPVGGWPVAIVQHGITRSRTDAVAIADSFADACTIVVSMDLPLHGITATDPANPLTKLHCFLPPAAPNPACLAGTPYAAYERTFDVDLDGVAGIDSSGAYMINLTNPITGRDNLRQGEADMIQLARSVPGLAVLQAAPGSLPAGPVGVNADHVGFVGLSLGSMVGAAAGQYSAADLSSTALSVPGGVITRLLLDSATFGPAIRSALQAKGLTPNSTPFWQFFRDFQTVIDSGDPFNHIKATQAALPTLLFMVNNDQVIPNTATQRLVYAGGLSLIGSAGAHSIAAGSGAWSYFTQGSHGTLFDPTASLLATMEMQAQAVTFTATSGAGLQVGLVSTDVLGFTYP